MYAVRSQSVAPDNTRRQRKLTEKIENTARVAPLVVVPGDKLDEVIVKGNTGLDVEDGRVSVTVQISGDELILGVGENACV
jgi:hypothetical protein